LLYEIVLNHLKIILSLSGRPGIGRFPHFVLHYVVPHLNLQNFVQSFHVVLLLLLLPLFWEKYLILLYKVVIRDVIFRFFKLIIFLHIIVLFPRLHRKVFSFVFLDLLRNSLLGRIKNALLHDIITVTLRFLKLPDIVINDHLPQWSRVPYSLVQRLYIPIHALSMEELRLGQLSQVIINNTNSIV
jgi:hypothetical protein